MGQGDGDASVSLAHPCRTKHIYSVMWLRSRSEAALELLLVYFQDQLDWTKGWSIPSQQFILGTKRRDPKAVAVRRFDAGDLSARSTRRGAEALRMSRLRIP